MNRFAAALPFTSRPALRFAVLRLRLRFALPLRAFFDARRFRPPPPLRGTPLRKAACVACVI
jgi:hypothetical protein